MNKKMLSINGIENKAKVEFMENYLGIDIFTGIVDSEAFFFIGVDDSHILLTSSSLENTKKGIAIINNDNISVKEFLLQNLIETIKQEKYISLGVAEYFGKLPEALSARERVKEKYNQREKEKKERKEILKIKEENELKDLLNMSENEFKMGNSISKYHFVCLCKQKGIIIPLKTLGWLNKYAKSISYNSISHTSKNSSRVIFRYINQLKEMINNANYNN